MFVRCLVIMMLLLIGSGTFKDSFLEPGKRVSRNEYDSFLKSKYTYTVNGIVYRNDIQLHKNTKRNRALFLKAV